MAPLLRRALGGTAAVVALALAYSAGVATGAGLGQPAPSAPGVLDEAADSIADDGLRPVPRPALEAAAIEGMLSAAGDRWGSWAASPPAVPVGAPTRGGVRLRPVASAARPADHDVPRLQVPAFPRGTGSSVRAALAELRGGGARGVLLDLRGNGGGRLDEAVETASAFLDGGPVVSYTRRDGREQVLEAVGTGDPVLPLVVLVDGSTASAAEVVAGALQDRGRAVLVGSRTYGKGSVQEPQPLPDGSSLDLTVARWATPSGRSVEGTGLVPDIEVAPGAAADVAVRRGLVVLRGLQASTGAEVAP